jgi:hypothetical protein
LEFKPTPNQGDATLHLDGPLFLPARPGSGKTPVLLLNIYAHIWQNLRGQALDEVAIIATAYPETMHDALLAQNEEEMLRELKAWDPVVGIEVEPDHVQKIIRDFGHAVDCIEDGKFQPAPLQVLKDPFGKKNTTFGTAVCRNCDARFSCDSYCQFATGSRMPKETAFKKYLDDSAPNWTSRIGFPASWRQDHWKRCLNKGDKDHILITLSFSLQATVAFRRGLSDFWFFGYACT